MAHLKRSVYDDYFIASLERVDRTGSTIHCGIKVLASKALVDSCCFWWWFIVVTLLRRTSTCIVLICKSWCWIQCLENCFSLTGRRILGPNSTFLPKFISCRPIYPELLKLTNSFTLTSFLLVTLLLATDPHSLIHTRARLSNWTVVIWPIWETEPIWVTPINDSKCVSARVIHLEATSRDVRYVLTTHLICKLRSGVVVRRLSS